MRDVSLEANQNYSNKPKEAGQQLQGERQSLQHQGATPAYVADRFATNLMDMVRDSSFVPPELRDFLSRHDIKIRVASGHDLPNPPTSPDELRNRLESPNPTPEPRRTDPTQPFNPNAKITEVLPLEVPGIDAYLELNGKSSTDSEAIVSQFMAKAGIEWDGGRFVFHANGGTAVDPNHPDNRVTVMSVGGRLEFNFGGTSVSEKNRQIFENQVLTALDNSFQEAEDKLNKVLSDPNRTESQEVMALNQYHRTVATYSKLALGFLDKNGMVNKNNFAQIEDRLAGSIANVEIVYAMELNDAQKQNLEVALKGLPINEYLASGESGFSPSGVPTALPNQSTPNSIANQILSSTLTKR